MTDYLDDEPPRDLVDYLMDKFRDAFAELWDRPDSMATAVLFCEGEIGLWLTRDGLLVVQKGDLGDRLEQELRSDLRHGESC